MPDALIIGYGVTFDDDGRVLLLHRRPEHPPWADHWWLPGDVTPLTEEPDATVPRIFEHLMRQRVAAGFIATIFGEEPETGRHTVHNAYRVTVIGALDSQPQDETNPFDAAEWYGPEQALAVLPSEQAALLKTALDLDAAGVVREPAGNLDALFAEEPTRAPLPTTPTRRPREERRALGAELLAEVTGNPNIANALPDQLGALGDWLVEHVWGEVWQTEQPSRRDRGIAALALCASLRLHDALRFNVTVAEAMGLSRDEIAEVCLQLAADIGFPYANETLGLLSAHWKLESGSFAPARELPPPISRPATTALDRTSRAWAIEEVYSRPQLATRERAIVSLMAILALGPSEAADSHMANAFRSGVTAEELDGLMPLVAVFAGIHRAETGERALKRLVE